MNRAFVCIALLIAQVAIAQVADPGNAGPPASNAAPAPNSYGVTQALGQLELISQSTAIDLGRVRVDKWKADGKYKDQAKDNIESLQRNLTAAVPALVQQVRSNPGSLAVSVRLYRNLNALYDVLASVTESAGAFGSKDDYNALANDTANLDNVRRTVAEDLERMAANSDAQVSRLMSQIRAQQSSSATAQPSRKIIDDTAPAKKKATPKKKPAKSTAAPK